MQLSDRDLLPKEQSASASTQERLKGETGNQNKEDASRRERVSYWSTIQKERKKNIGIIASKTPLIDPLDILE